MRTKMRLLALLACLWCQAVQAQPHSQLPVLRTATEVARHPSLDLDQQPRVRLEASVTYIDQPSTVFLQDHTGATFIRSSDYWKTLRVGQRIHIEGTRYPGLYIGGIIAEKVVLLGEGPPPVARASGWNDLASGRYHYEMVEVQGVGRWMELREEGTAVLRMNVDGKTLVARFDQVPDQGERFIDAKLQIRGLAAGAINDRRQLVMPYLRVADSGSVTVMIPPPEDPFARDALPLSVLPQSGAEPANAHRIKVSGTALSGLIQEGFFIRDDERSLHVLTPLKLPLQAGDEVEVVGFVEMGVFSARLADAIFRVLDHGEAPAPRRVSAADLADGGMDADLITMNGRVVQLLDDRQTLFVQSGPHSIRVMSPQSLVQDMVPGAEVELTGLCRVVATAEEGFRASASAFELWLRSPADAVVTAAPSWWTAGRLGMALAAVAGLAFLALAWATLLRRRVAGQLAVIEGKVQREAVMEERQRIAREFHDTLEQELAGLSLRLDAATPRVSDEKARNLLEQQRKLLLRLQTETRDFVWDLRDASRHRAPLDAALGSLLEHLQASTTTPLSLRVQGEIPKMPALVQHHVLSLTREAVNNAVKYARATSIEVTAETSSGELKLGIADNGDGFDVAGAMALDGHFGIRGMKERAQKIGGELEICSSPGEGTRVKLTVPACHLPMEAAQTGGGSPTDTGF